LVVAGCSPEHAANSVAPASASAKVFEIIHLAPGRCRNETTGPRLSIPARPDRSLADGQRARLSTPWSARAAAFAGAGGSQMRRVGWQAMPTVEHPFTLPSVGQARHCCLISVQVGDADTSARVKKNIRTSSL
jgi:hypothetical protein